MSMPMWAPARSKPLLACRSPNPNPNTSLRIERKHTPLYSVLSRFITQSSLYT